MELVTRITGYLASGGLFNPEMAIHERIRDLLIDCREALSEPDPSSEAGLRELIRAMTFDKCPYCLGSSRGRHNPMCPVDEALAEEAAPASPIQPIEGRKARQAILRGDRTVRDDDEY